MMMRLNWISFGFSTHDKNVNNFFNFLNFLKYYSLLKMPLSRNGKKV